MKSCLVFPLIILASLHLNLFSQNAATTQPQKRIALVIGNGNYPSSTLANPESDAKSMAAVLQQLGFTVYEYENLSQGQMKKAIDDFGLKLKGNDVGLFFYAGHGIQSKGYNYLIPVDAQLQTEADVEYDCVQADRILAKMEGLGTKVNIIILDACRNNPFERSWTRSETGKGLAFMNAPSGTLIAYSTAPGNTALDGSGENSPYTSAILENIVSPGITILQMFQNVRATVSEKSNKQQIPWESTSLIGDFYFNTDRNVPVAVNQDKPQMESLEVTISKESPIFFVDPRDSREYKTVQIGSQIWMAENLNYKTSSGSWEYKDPSNTTTYGQLYNWNAAKQACPVGWHLPSDSEWATLTDYLGGITIAGRKLKEYPSVHWITSYAFTVDQSGFQALPGGERSIIGENGAIGYGAYFWTSSSHGGSGWLRALQYNSTYIQRYRDYKFLGLSVRCLKD